MNIAKRVGCPVGEIAINNKCIPNFIFKPVDKKSLTSKQLSRLKEWRTDPDEQLEQWQAKPINYQKNMWYHVYNPSMGTYPGVGEGLYVGKDKKALKKFYGVFGGKCSVTTYKGKPKMLDLTREKDYNNFQKIAKQVFPNEKNNNELRKLALSGSYDGIRYYDPWTTGEEFVVFRDNVLQKTKTESFYHD